MKQYIETMQKILVVILATLSFSGCGLGAPTSDQLGTQKEQEFPHKIEDEKQENNLPNVVSYEGAIDKYIKEFGEPKITFNQDGATMSVTIETKRLLITSAQEGEEMQYYTHLYSDGDVMKKFFDGTTKDEKYAATRIKSFVDRWKNNNPFSGFTVRIKEEQPQAGQFVGNIVLGGSDEANSAEVAYFLKKDKWDQKFGTELVGATTLFYAPELAKRQFSLPNGETFERIVATCRTDNKYSAKILQYCCMQVYGRNNKFGYDRDLYQLPMEGIYKKK